MNRNTLLGVALVFSGAFSCASRPTPLVYPVWVNWEGKTAAFGQSRNYITSSCAVLKREEASAELRSDNDLRLHAKELGADTVLVEQRDSGKLDRTSFYNCPSFPNGDVQGPIGPSHEAPTK